MANLNLDPLTLQGNYISSTENQSQSICNTETNQKDTKLILDSLKSKLSIQDINIDMLPDGYFSWAQAIKSPRSKKAFEVASINPKEIDPVDI